MLSSAFPDDHASWSVPDLCIATTASWSQRGLPSRKPRPRRRESPRTLANVDPVATIVAAVRERRGTFSNIRKFLRFLLSSNIGEVRSDRVLGAAARAAVDRGADPQARP